MVFLELQREPGVHSRVTVGVAINNFCFFSDVRTPRSLRWTPQESRLGRTIRTLLKVRQETKVHFLVGTVILGFLSIFKMSLASSPYEALNSVCLSRVQRDVRHPVQMMRKPIVFLGSP